MSDDLGTIAYFSSLVYLINKPEFLDAARIVCDEFVEKQKETPLDEIYPVIMTENLYNDPRLDDFAKYVGQTAWNLLDSQGYDVSQLNTVFTEMWCQQHYKHSSMEQHVHGIGSQIVGFYFTKAPENCSRVVFHDPVAGRVMTGLPEKNISDVTQASRMVNFKPEPGMLMFTNAWLPHSFTRHGNDEPIQFIHFNLGVREAINTCNSDAEVI
jgi:uncharacterized protein (TIGR02466 family)